MRSPLAFFNTTPSGRILNRFSKDMDECKYIIIGSVLYISPVAYTGFWQGCMCFREYNTDKKSGVIFLS